MSDSIKDILQINVNGVAWDIADTEAREGLKTKLDKPSNGTEGQVLTYTAEGPAWMETMANADYSAFEVFAHDYDIPVGECEELGGYVSVAIPTALTETLKLWITEFYDQSDIIIDWGDNTVDKFSEVDESYFTGGADDLANKETEVTIAHTYATTGKYIVKIYGKDYCRISHSTCNSILCRCFAADLPIASHLTNLASFCSGCKNLISVNIPSYSYVLTNIVNWSSTFANCSNLLYVKGFDHFSYSLSKIGVFNSLFNTSHNLLETDFRIPSECINIQAIFQSCNNLTMDILDLLPENFVIATKNIIKHAFYGCSKLTCSDYEKLGNILWNNENITWDIQAGTTASGLVMYPFIGCSSTLRAQVPKSWGGTASDDIIKSPTYSTQMMIPIPEAIELSDIVTLVIEVSDDPLFSEPIQYTHKNCEIFNLATGHWINCPEEGFDIAQAGSHLRLKNNIKAKNRRYYWVVNGIKGVYHGL